MERAAKAGLRASEEDKRHGEQWSHVERSAECLPQVPAGHRSPNLSPQVEMGGLGSLDGMTL